jgi:hypothetical protein
VARKAGGLPDFSGVNLMMPIPTGTIGLITVMIWFVNLAILEA